MDDDSSLFEKISDDELIIDTANSHQCEQPCKFQLNDSICPRPPTPPTIFHKSNIQFQHLKTEVNSPIKSNRAKNDKAQLTVSNNNVKIKADWTDDDELPGNSSDENEHSAENSDQRIGDSVFWTQSIAPSKYYTRNRNGSQLATLALHELQQQFVDQVLGTIQAGQAQQPDSIPPPMTHFPNCSNCSHSHNHLSSTDSDEDYDSSSNNNSSSSTFDQSTDNEQDNVEMKSTFNLFNNKEKRHNLKGKSKRRRRSHRNGKSRQQHTNTMAQKQIMQKRSHPAALHSDIGFNEPGQLNDGPECKCSWEAKQIGVRHGKFEGEQPVPRCNWDSSNAEVLYHYVLQVQPNPGLFSRRHTEICFDGHTYLFDGFSAFFHRPLPEHFPQQSINQWSQHFQVRFVNENMPESFTINDLELFHSYMFENVLELYDLNRRLNIKDNSESVCYFYHCLPRFARQLPDKGKELLPMSTVLKHFLDAFRPFVTEKQAQCFRSDKSALLHFAHAKKGQICINPNKKPLAIRVDLLDSHVQTKSNIPPNSKNYPTITHFGIKPSAYAYLKKPQFREAITRHNQLRKKLSGKVELDKKEKQQLYESEANLRALKQECKSKRDITVHFSSLGFYSTGIYPDMVQHSILLIVACQHVRLHCSLDILESERLQYKFKNRALLELSLIHPSFRANYGTNPDHVKNVLNNCGLRISKIDKIEKVTATNNEILSHKVGVTNVTDSNNQQKLELIHRSGRRRGIQVLLEIMALQGCKHATDTNISLIRHNERLEFLGDAVVEFLTTVHLFLLFTELDEGGLATFRSALVQNRHLATMADHLGLQNFMVYAHGPDLCHEADLRHAMANAFEALMAAVFLDAGLEECDRIFGKALFKNEPHLLEIWNQLPEHPLKRTNSYGDRHLVESVPCLKLLSEFERCIGIRFKHIRLLAKAFTRRNVPFNFLTLGHNQRLEFLGDTVLQLIVSEYLYKHFPYHQEGHLSLLRTCLVSNKTQSVVCDDLAMGRYLIIPQAMLRKGQQQCQLRLKDKADLVESFLGALYIDRGLTYCRRFCQICFFPRLKYFIISQRWNDPKSQLQQCCLTLRSSNIGVEPDIPEYKTIGVEGPTNTRIYRVAVYFRNKRLAIGTGSSMHAAQMAAAENALSQHAHLFSNFTEKNSKVVAETGINNVKYANNGGPNEFANGGQRTRNHINELKTHLMMTNRRGNFFPMHHSKDMKIDRNARKRRLVAPNNNDHHHQGEIKRPKQMHTRD